MRARVIAVWIVLALVLAGPLQPMAAAQQATQAPAPQDTAQTQPAAPVQETAQATQPAPAPAPAVQPAPVEPQTLPPRREHKTDVYDVGAVAMNVVALPLKATTCVLGGAVGFSLLVLTFGSADRATANVVREGCGQKWIIRGNDIRPPRGAEEPLHDWDAYDAGAR
jgi:hypothetical protein